MRERSEQPSQPQPAPLRPPASTKASWQAQLHFDQRETLEDQSRRLGLLQLPLGQAPRAGPEAAGRRLLPQAALRVQCASLVQHVSSASQAPFPLVEHLQAGLRVAAQQPGLVVLRGAQYHQSLNAVVLQKRLQGRVGVQPQKDGAWTPACACVCWGGSREGCWPCCGPPCGPASLGGGHGGVGGPQGCEAGGSPAGGG